MADHHPAASLAPDIAFRPEEELAAYRQMLLIRRLEEKVGQLIALGSVVDDGRLCIGQEAVAVGLALAARSGDGLVTDAFWHGHALARGAAPHALLAALLGRDARPSWGRHEAQTALGLAHVCLDAGVPAALAAGQAMAMRHLGRGRLSVAAFGGGADGTPNQVARVLRLAAGLALPLVLAVVREAPPALSTAQAAAQSDSDLCRLAVSFGMAQFAVDGCDVRRVRAAARVAFERARQHMGPVLLELWTPPFRGHATPPEKGHATASGPHGDPVALARARIKGENVASEAALRALEKDVRLDVSRAVAEARTAADGAAGGRRDRAHS